MDRVDYQSLLVQDLITWNSNGELDLSPWYQRRAVWTQPQKAYLINTLFENKPIPTLYFRHSIDLEADRSLREVVDGQQRIRAILEYVNNEFSVTHPQHSRKIKQRDLTKDQRRRFRETGLSVAWLLGAADQDVIEVFGRLNSVAKTLNAAEKRNAAYGGEFKQFCLREAASRVSLWRDLNIFTANEIARMQEIQFVADIVLNLQNGLSDYSAPKLDSAYRNNDEEFKQSGKIKKRLDRCFNVIAGLPRAAIADTIFSRQPILFSLLIVIDSLPTLPSGKTLHAALKKIDERYNTDTPVSERTKSDAEFYEACIASTQRIKSRRVRDRYLKRYIK